MKSILPKVIQLVCDGVYIRAAHTHIEALCWSDFHLFLDCIKLVIALLLLQVAALAFSHFPFTII